MNIKTCLILLILSVFASILPVDAGMSSAPCPLAPRSRLHIGDAALVADGVQGLNLRALPARDTRVVVLLNAGTPLTVLDGSSCNGGYNWWRVETYNGYRGWVAEGTWQGYWIVPTGDADRAVSPLEWTCGVGLGSRRCPLP